MLQDLIWRLCKRSIAVPRNNIVSGCDINLFSAISVFIRIWIYLFMYALYCRKCSWQLGINSNASQKEFAGQWEIIFKRKSLKISFRKNLSLKFCKNARFIKAFPGFHQNIYHVFESAQFFQSPLLFTVKQTFTRQMISFAELIFF